MSTTTGGRRVTPTLATPGVTRAASSRITVSLPNSAKSSGPKTAGPISTPASKAIKGSETGLRYLRTPPSIPRSNSGPPTAAKVTHNSSIQASVGSSLSLSLVNILCCGQRRALFPAAHSPQVMEVENIPEVRPPSAPQGPPHPRVVQSRHQARREEGWMSRLRQPARAPGYRGCAA